MSYPFQKLPDGSVQINSTANGYTVNRYRKRHTALFSVSTDPKYIEESLNSELDRIAIWFKTNRLTLNATTSTPPEQGCQDNPEKGTALECKRTTPDTGLETTRGKENPPYLHNVIEVTTYICLEMTSVFIGACTGRTSSTMGETGQRTEKKETDFDDASATSTERQVAVLLLGHSVYFGNGNHIYSVLWKASGKLLQRKVKRPGDENPIQLFLKSPFEHRYVIGYKHCEVTFERTRNFQAFDLGYKQEWADDEGKAERFLADIERDFTLVMILEHFDESLVLLRRLMCWEIKDILYDSRPKKQRSYAYKDYKPSDEERGNHEEFNKDEANEKFGWAATCTFVLTINQTQLEVVSATCLLGVWIQKNLNFGDMHVDKTVNKANGRLAMLRKIKLLEYCVPVWHSGLTATQTERLESGEQLRHTILGMTYIDYQTALLNKGLKSLQERRVRSPLDRDAVGLDPRSDPDYANRFS
ncbi:hypothetical protein Bbelb_345570 [Branchiostoma belcheri]|nr:hypothetical protein Bbelb_345570 [Branchiostoma belcheri]